MVTFLNNGNTCYFNVLMQIILHSNVDNKIEKTKLGEGWYSIINKLKGLSPNTIYNPKLLYRLLNWHKHFRYGKKHDAHEAFLYLIDLIDDSNFKGHIVECMITRNSPFEHCFRSNEFTSLEIWVNHNTLDKCIDDFFKIDVINDWKDSKNNKRTLLKTSCINTNPVNLLILLRQTYEDKKFVQYPLELDISKWCSCSENTTYYLKSVVIHDNEHYYIFCKESNSWYLYNDEARIPINSNEWMYQEPAYMLIYDYFE